ncbi:MAG TPA: chorismate-binding protein, partial [Ktedonobacterales bacterium]
MRTATQAHPLASSPTTTVSGLLPVTREISADLETPISAYLKLATGRYGFLLESAGDGQHQAHYSIIGPEPYMALRIKGDRAERHWLSGERSGQVDCEPCVDPVACVRAELDRRPLSPSGDAPHYGGGAYGYFAYEVAARYEASVPIPDGDSLGVPDAVFCFVDTLVLFDHPRQRIQLVTYVDMAEAGGDVSRARAAGEARLDALERRLAGASPPTAHAPSAPAEPLALSPTPLESREAYQAAVRRIKRHIRAGDCYQVVPSRRIARSTSANPLAVYRALRRVNPS